MVAEYLGKELAAVAIASNDSGRYPDDAPSRLAEQAIGAAGEPERSSAVRPEEWRMGGSGAIRVDMVVPNPSSVVRISWVL